MEHTTHPPATIPEPTAEDHLRDLEYLYESANKSRNNVVEEPATSKTGAPTMPGWRHRESFHRDAEGTVQSLIRLLAASQREAERLQAQRAEDLLSATNAIHELQRESAALRARVAALEAAGDGLVSFAERGAEGVFFAKQKESERWTRRSRDQGND